MQKLGRNDPCYCGSGLKYKKCCLRKDEAANVARISAEQPLSTPDIIDRELDWPNELHRLIAMHFWRKTEGLYEDDEILSMVITWNRFALETVPVTKKIGVYPAALEYVLCQVFEHETTQSALAEKYQISVTTLSQRANQIYDFLLSNNPDLTEGSAGPFAPKTPVIGSANSRMSAEQEMARLHRLLEQQDFASIEEANAFLQQNLNRVPASTHKASPEDQAADLLYRAWEEPDPQRRTKLAQDALQLDANNADAYNILAECANSPKEKAYFYKQGMRVAEAHFGDAFFEKNKGHFWGLLQTRPYMRAKKGYAEICEMMDNMPEAIKHYRELLELNPNDNQGVRDLLVPAYIETEEWKAAEALIQRYDEDISAFFNYSRVLVEYGLRGQSAKLTTRIREAVANNPYVPAYLKGNKRLPRQMPEYIGFGDDREAIAYALLNRHLWQIRPELLQLLPAGKR